MVRGALKIPVTVNLQKQDKEVISPTQVVLSQCLTSSPYVKAGNTKRKMSGGWWKTAQSSGLPLGKTHSQDRCKSELTRAILFRYIFIALLVSYNVSNFG